MEWLSRCMNKRTAPDDRNESEVMKTIKYRPHRGSLADAMAEAREFGTVEDLKRFVWSSWNEELDLSGALKVLHLFEPEDIVIGEILGDDNRIGWKNVRHVCIKRCGSEVYATPQCIGWCGE